MYATILKPLFDFFAAFFGLLLLSPIWIPLLVILLFANNGKPFFLQKRPGKNENIFYVIKFRSMADRRDEKGELLGYELRITQIGRFIRKYSLDEIPQLFNVLKGEMSLIGPRPLLVEYLELYNSDQRKRHLVKPGITGWAQVNGRNTINWDRKFSLDIWYVDNISFPLDLRILFITIKNTLLKKDINSSENLNMPKFTGNESL